MNLERALRENRARRKRDGFNRRVSTWLDIAPRDIELIEPEAMQELARRVESLEHNTFYWGMEVPTASVQAVLDRVAASVRGVVSVVAVADSEDVGSVVTLAENAIRRALSLVELDREWLRAYDRHGTWGVWLEHLTEYGGPIPPAPAWELTLFGGVFHGVTFPDELQPDSADTSGST